MRRFGSRRSRSDGRPRARAPPTHRSPGQQRRHRRALQLPRSGTGEDRAGDARQLPRQRVVDARVSAGPRRGVTHRQPRVGRGHRRRRSVLGVEARTTRLLALDRRGTRAARDHGPHRQPRVRRDGRLSATRALPRCTAPVRDRPAARRRARARCARQGEARDLRATLVSPCRLGPGGRTGSVR